MKLEHWIGVSIFQTIAQIWMWAMITHFLLPADSSVIGQWWGIPYMFTVIISIICGVIFCIYMAETSDKRAKIRAEKLAQKEKLMETLKNGLPN